MVSAVGAVGVVSAVGAVGAVGVVSVVSAVDVVGAAVNVVRVVAHVASFDTLTPVEWSAEWSAEWSGVSSGVVCRVRWSGGRWSGGRCGAGTCVWCVPLSQYGVWWDGAVAGGVVPAEFSTPRRFEIQTGDVSCCLPCANGNAAGYECGV